MRKASWGLIAETSVSPTRDVTVLVSFFVAELLLRFSLRGSAKMTNLLLYQRIAQQLAEDIRRGVYRPGERVPSVRKMS